MDPLIVDLLLEPAARERFDGLRRAHFPPERLVVGAHLTLFHALPGALLAEVQRELAAAAARPGFSLQVVGPVLLGRGVAYRLRAAELAELHRELQQAWQPHLTAQDRQRLSPHVTVQNKVAPEQARALHAALAAQFTPYDVAAVGLGLWRYRGGPWEPVQQWSFQSAT